MQNVLMPVVLVLARRFLNCSLIVEMEGHCPWTT